MLRSLLSGLTACVLLYACQPASSPTVVAPPTDTTIPIYVGTYTQALGHVNGRATGIYTCRFDTVSGTLSIADSCTDIANPSFVCVSPDKQYLYAVGENGGSPAQPYGSVAAYRIGAKGHLSKINERPSYGVAPCHVSTDRTGKWVFIANYGTGNIASYQVLPDGSLSDSLYMRRHPGQHPWAHQVLPSPDNTLLYAADKGADRLFLYQMQETGVLRPQSEVPFKAGTGPRHLDFSPVHPGQFAVIGELSCSVLTFQRDAGSGKITLLDSLSTLPAGYTAKNTCADIHYHPNGQFLYGSNRGHNSIAVFKVLADGRLQAIGHVPSGGTIPRNFLITSDGKWMLTANQNSSTVQAYRIDPATGIPTPSGQAVRVPTPVCLKQ
jgi:6-phosphogluconolactonase